MKNSWNRKELRDVCKVFADGDWIESKDQSSNGIRLIQTGNIGKGTFRNRIKKARYISEATFKRLKCTEIYEGDCLISRLPDPVGRCCLIPDVSERMITAVDCTIVRFDQKQILPQFFNFYSQSQDYLDTVDSETTGTTRKRISRSKLGLIPISVPTIPEQKRIAAILDQVFAGLDIAKANAEKNLQYARALFESHLQTVFTQRGKGWVDKPLGTLATFRNGINYTKESKGERVKIVGVKDFKNSFWVNLGDLDTVTMDNNLKEMDALKQGDILAVRSNGNLDLIGRTILAGEVPAKISHSGFTIRIRLENGEVLPQYLCHFMKCGASRQQLVEGGTGTNIKSLNQQTLSALVIPFPSLANQKALVAKLELLSIETQRLASIYQQKLTALEELKKSLLHQAFNGYL